MKQRWQSASSSGGAVALRSYSLRSRNGSNRRTARLDCRSPALKFFRYGIAIHVPLQRLALFFAMMWLIPEGARALLEVQLLIVIGGWILIGALVVNALNAVLATEALADVQSAGLRLRSLRLIGRVVVASALILLISDRLVGQGTIYRWVFSTRWVAAVPVFLVLTRWWRDTGFARIERVRRKMAFRQWALANRTRCMSCPSATYDHSMVRSMARSRTRQVLCRIFEYE